MKLSRWQAVGSLILAAVLSAPAWGANTGNKSAIPGTVNYVEGQVSIDQQSLDSKSIGSAEVAAGQNLTTGRGKAEVLLTPGVFLRMGDNSSIKMVSPDLTRTEVSLDGGSAMLEVAEIHRENDIRINQNGVSARILKTGLYAFDADQKELRVFDGKEVVQDGDREITVKGGHELALNAGELKARGFDKKQYADSDLYRFSSLRSSYLAEANVDAANIYVSNGWYGPGWFGSGWYWDPWFASYTFIPGDGIFYSPFGWGFYSPLVVYRAPIWHVGGYSYHHFGPDYRPPINRGFGRPAVGRPASGFRPAPMMSQPRGPASFGGGFHGSMGGRR